VCLAYGLFVFAKDGLQSIVSSFKMIQYTADRLL
jgi:hypothetical protein